MPLRFSDVVDRPLFAGSPFRWPMGVRVLAAADWLQPDDARAADLAEKAALISARGEEMVAALPGAEGASEEVWQLVTADLDRRGLSAPPGGVHPIDRAGRSVQEDLCVMERRRAEWILTAGSVCFPTRWALADKIGCSIGTIHGPVPGYGDQIASRVDRFFDRMTAGTLAWRLNWSLVGDRGRRLEPRSRQAPPSPPPDVATDLFVRIERQTFRRLVDHPAIVFGIRIHVWPLGEVVDELPLAEMAATLDSMPLDVAVYKNLEGIRGELGEWVRGRSRRGSTPKLPGGEAP